MGMVVWGGVWKGYGGMVDVRRCGVSSCLSQNAG